MEGKVIGTVFGEASTERFSFIFSPQKAKNLRNAFVVVEIKERAGKVYRVIGKVVDILTDNPLLSPENLKFFLDEGIGSKVGNFFRSDRFKTYVARCEVIGEFDEERQAIRPLTKPVETGAPVLFIDRDLLEALFFDGKPYNLFPGSTEQVREARFSLDGDQIVTMHCGIFGMTGMGKTTTTGTLLEELTIRGVKSIVFDPHGDYEKLGILKDKFYSAVRREAMNVGTPLGKLVNDYRNYLKTEWRGLSDRVPPELKGVIEEEIEGELSENSICFRLALIASVLMKRVALPVEGNDVSGFRELLLKFADSFTFEEVRRRVPEDVLKRLIKIRVNGYPNIILDDFFNKYFVMNLIEAYSGEEISEAQQGYFVKWLESLGKEEGEQLLKKLISLLERETRMREETKNAIKRKLEKAKMTLKAQNEAIPVDAALFVSEFSSKTGSLSLVSNVIFDLSSLSPETVQRALLYSVVYSAFHLHKSRRLSVQRGDFPILFVIEEARALIPRSGAEDIDHPASKFARNIVRRVATEGRKMGLGLIIISQKPASVDPLPVSQCNTLILHRVINPEDLSFVKTVGESISQEDIETLKTVERGVSIITGTALKTRRSLLVRFRDRLSKEGREHPKPLRNLWHDAQ